MRIGIIGLGKIAQTKYLPALVKIARDDIIALYDQSSSLVGRIISRYGFNKEIICYSVDELINREPELVFVLTHNHYEVAKILLENKISICVEKPLCWEVIQAKDLLACAKENHVKIYASYMKQFDQTFKLLQKEITKRGVPLVVNVSCYAGNNKQWCDPLFDIYKESSEEKRYTKQELKESWNAYFLNNSVEGVEHQAESQLLLQLGIHQLNLIRKLFGHLEVRHAIFSHNNSVCTINTMLQGSDNTIINYSLVPLFSGAWVWKEKYEIIYQDALITYHPGCPFLPMSDSWLEIAEENGNMSNTVIKSGMIDSFELMLRSILKNFYDNEEYTSALEAIEDIKLIEALLTIGKNV